MSRIALRVVLLAVWSLLPIAAYSFLLSAVLALVLIAVCSFSG